MAHMSESTLSDIAALILSISVSVIDEWKKQGKPAWQLLEPVDGFHANQVCLTYQNF